MRLRTVVAALAIGGSSLPLADTVEQRVNTALRGMQDETREVKAIRRLDQAWLVAMSPEPQKSDETDAQSPG